MKGLCQSTERVKPNKELALICTETSSPREADEAESRQGEEVATAPARQGPPRDGQMPRVGRDQACRCCSWERTTGPLLRAAWNHQNFKTQHHLLLTSGTVTGPQGPGACRHLVDLRPLY